MLVAFFCDDIEKFSVEATKTVESVYNADKIIVNNLNITSLSFNLIPSGFIVGFFGDHIPSGWVLCDGNNNTPDLRGKLVKGIDLSWFASNNSNNFISGLSGGNSFPTLKVENLPPHTHTFLDKINVGGGMVSGSNNCMGQQSDTTDAAGQQTPLPLDIRPPFFAIKYIMKM